MILSRGHFLPLPIYNMLPRRDTVHRVAKSWTPLKQLSAHTHHLKQASSVGIFRKKNYVSMCLFPPPSPVASCNCAKSRQLCPILCNPMDYSPPGSTLWRGLSTLWASQAALVVKKLPANAGDVRDMGSIPRLERSPGVGNDNHSCVLAWEIP